MWAVFDIQRFYRTSLSIASIRFSLLLICLIILYVEKITGVYVTSKNNVSVDVCRKQYAQTLTSGIVGETSGTAATPTRPGAKY
jgi:hypothetical protein